MLKSTEKTYKLRTFITLSGVKWLFDKEAVCAVGSKAHLDGLTQLGVASADSGGVEGFEFLISFTNFFRQNMRDSDVALMV